MKSSVITFPGSNCDRDMDVALKKFGFKNKMVWHDDTELPKSDLVVLAYSQLADLPEIRKAEMDVDRLPVLALESGLGGGKKIVDWNLSTAKNWSKQMVELVDRQREMMIEF